MKISLRILCRHAVLCWYFKRIFWMLLEHLPQHKRIRRMQHIFLSTFIYKFMTCLLLLASSFSPCIFRKGKSTWKFFISNFFCSSSSYAIRVVRRLMKIKFGGRKTIFTEEIVWNLWTFMLSSFITLHVSLCKFPFNRAQSTKKKEKL